MKCIRLQLVPKPHPDLNFLHISFSTQVYEFLLIVMGNTRINAFILATRLGCHWFMEASTLSLIFYHDKYKDLNYCYNVIIFLKKKTAMWGG